MPGRVTGQASSRWVCLAALRMAPRSSSQPPATPTTGSLPSVRARRPPRGRLSNRFWRSTKVRARRHIVRTTRCAPWARAAMPLGGSVVSPAAVSNWSSDCSAVGRGTGVAAVRSRSNSIRASRGTQSDGSTGPRVRARRHRRRARPLRRRGRPAAVGGQPGRRRTRGAAAARAAPIAIRRSHQSTRFDSGQGCPAR